MLYWENYIISIKNIINTLDRNMSNNELNKRYIEKICDFFSIELDTSYLSSNLEYLGLKELFKSNKNNHLNDILNLHNIINEVNLSKTCLLLYFFNDIIYSKKNKFEPIYNIESLIDGSLYKDCSFSSNLLLATDSKTNTLYFLILFYHPISVNFPLLNHPTTQDPIIKYNEITENHFDMLLYLMERESFSEFTIYKKNFNLNHLLIVNFLEQLLPTNMRKKEINWTDLGLPTSKIKKLLNKGFLLNDFKEHRDREIYYTFPCMERAIKEIIVGTDRDFFEETFKNIENDEKLIKI